MSHSLESLMRAQLTPAASDAALRQLGSFLLVGAGAALSFVAISSGLIAAFPGVPAWLVSALCYAAYVVPVYLLHRRYSFRSDAAHRLALPRYVLVQLLGIGLATAFSFAVYSIAGSPSVVGAILVIGLTSGVNFVVLRLWVFSHGEF